LKVIEQLLVEKVAYPFQAFQPKRFWIYHLPLVSYTTRPFHLPWLGDAATLGCKSSMCGEVPFGRMFLLFSAVNCSQSQFGLGSRFSKPAISIFYSILLLLAYA